MEVRQHVCSSVCLALTVINLKVVMREFLSLTDLSGAKTLYIHRPAEVVVFDEYKNFVIAAFWVVPLCLEGFNDS